MNSEKIITTLVSASSSWNTAHNHLSRTEDWLTICVYQPFLMEVSRHIAEEPFPKWAEQLKDDFLFVRLLRCESWTADHLLTALLWACVETIPRQQRRVRWWVRRLLRKGARWERCFVQEFLAGILHVIHYRYDLRDCGDLFVFTPAALRRCETADLSVDAQRLLDVLLKAGLPINSDYPDSCPHVDYLPAVISTCSAKTCEHLANLGADTHFFIQTERGGPRLSMLDFGLRANEKCLRNLILRGCFQLHPGAIDRFCGQASLPSVRRLLAAQIMRVTMVRCLLTEIFPYDIAEACRRYEFDPRVERRRFRVEHSCYSARQRTCSVQLTCWWSFREALYI